MLLYKMRQVHNWINTGQWDDQFITCQLELAPPLLPPSFVQCQCLIPNFVFSSPPFLPDLLKPSTSYTTAWWVSQSHFYPSRHIVSHWSTVGRNWFSFNTDHHGITTTCGLLMWGLFFVTNVGRGECPYSEMKLPRNHPLIMVWPTKNKVKQLFKKISGPMRKLLYVYKRGGEIHCKWYKY